MKSIKLFVTVLALSFSAALFAQNKTVTGVVTDAATGEPLPGAAVQVKGTATGVVTNVDGVYSVNVPANGVLVFSCISYETVEKAVNGATKLNVALPVDANLLEETVVYGYGSAKKIGTIVASVTNVSSEIVKNAPSSSALDQLQGQVAGLSVLTSSGVAGDDAVSMTLHGTGSLGSSSEPLFVIDGIPSSSRSVQSMNPNDIVSVAVLKDATATSIYGSRAANGVVYIVTKGGSYSSKSSVTVRSQYGANTLANPAFYENMMTGDELVAFRLATGTMTLAQLETQFFNNGFTANTKWHEVLQRPVTMQSQNDVTIEGGSDKVAYLISASQFHQDGQTVGNYYDRYTVRTNVQAHPVKWLKVGANVSLSLDEKMTNPNWGDNESGTSKYTSGGLSFLLNPLYPAIDPETGELYKVKFPNGIMNPYYYMENTHAVYNRYSMNGNAFVEITLAKGLKLSSKVGTDAYIRFGEARTLPSYINANGSGARSRAVTFSHSDIITNTLEYSGAIGNDHSFSVLLGQEGINNVGDGFSASSSKITDDRLLNLQNGAQETYGVSESFSQSRFLSYFAHADYDYAGKYFLDFTVRNDASSRFGMDVRNATFWAVGGMWKISKESFMRNVPAVNDLNFKVSYGTQGNAAIGNYNHLGLIGASGAYAENPNSQVVAQPSNNKLTWEQQGLFTIGFNGRILNRVNFEAEFYNRTTSNMLMAVPQPYTTGFDEVTANVGALKNTGVDLTLGVDIIRTKSAFLAFNTVFNFNKEVVTELFDAAWDEDLQRYRWEIASTGVAYVVGQPVGFYAPIYAGVDPEDGAPMWYLPGEDRDVTTKEATTKSYDEDALTQNTGLKRHAPINGGFGFSGAWKGFSFKADFSYVLGKTLINNDEYFYANPCNNVTFNCNKAVSDYWTPENPNAKWPDWTKGYKLQFDTHLYEDASFLRLKNLQVAYDLATLLPNQKFVKNAKITFTGRNLFLLTNYSGIDPEVDSNLTYGIAGNSRQFLGGIEITF